MHNTPFHTESHRRLNLLSGVWDTTITMLDASGGEGVSSHATDTYRWMPNGHFLTHEVDATMGGQRIQSTEIFGVDRTTGTFFSRSYDADGSTNDFTSNIEGRIFTINGMTQRFSGEFSQDGHTLQGEWKHLVNDRWLPFVRITLTRRE